MANEVGLAAAVTDLDAVRAEESFRTDFLAVLSEETGWTHAQSVVLSALCTVHAFASVLAIISPSYVRAWRFAVVTDPPRQAVTHSIDVVAFSAVVAVALFLAVQAVRALLAGMLAGQSNVARSALEFASDMVARCLCWHVFRAALGAVLAIISVRTLLIAESAHPASLTEAFAAFRIARRVVFAIALV